MRRELLLKMNFHSAILLWTILLNTNNEVSGISNHPQLICCKENLNIAKHELIKTTASHFKDFVRNSDVFVDKSSLVNLVSENSSFISLTYPKKWGKSINLNMLKTFLEIETDYKGKATPLRTTWSYRFFKHGEIMNEDGTLVKLRYPPMIARNEHIMKSYLGRHPVIYVDLSSFNMISLDFEGFFKSFQKRIASTFQEHNYVIEAYRDELDNCESNGCDRQTIKNLLTKFKLYRTGQEDSQDKMITSLVFLSKILKSHFNQLVYVLIDDYDIIVRKAYLEASSLANDEAEKILQFFTRFISITMGTSDSVQMGIVTGIFNLDIFDKSLNFLTPINYNLLNKNVHPFYGFTINQVKILLSQSSIEHNLVTEAIEHYKGYRMGDFPDILIYDPWLIVNFVNKRKLDNFRHGMGESEISLFMIRNDEIRNILHDVIFGKKDSFSVHFHTLTLCNEDLSLLKKVINNTEFIPDFNAKTPATSVFTYFFACGYFTLHIPSVFIDLPKSMEIEFANQDIRNNIREEYSNKLDKKTT